MADMPTGSAIASPPLGPRTWLHWLGIGLAAGLARLPWPLQRVLGRGFGRLLRVGWRSRREIAERNLALCFPERDAAARARLLRDHFDALGIGLFEFARAWWGSVTPLERGLVLEGMEHLEAARAGGRGVIIVSGHFTTLEACGRMLAERVPLAGMYRPHGQPALEWAVLHGRLRYAGAMFSREALRPAVRHLKQGGLLWFAPDQDTRRGESVFVPFFGQAAWSLTSTHQLARMSGAAVLAFAHERRADGGYTLRLSPAFEDFPSSDATDDTARVMAAVEAMARAAPAQYLWIHRRFKRRPGDDRAGYGDGERAERSLP